MAASAPGFVEPPPSRDAVSRARDATFLLRALVVHAVAASLLGFAWAMVLGVVAPERLAGSAHLRACVARAIGVLCLTVVARGGFRFARHVPTVPAWGLRAASVLAVAAAGTGASVRLVSGDGAPAVLALLDLATDSSLGLGLAAALAAAPGARGTETGLAVASVVLLLGGLGGALAGGEGPVVTLAAATARVTAFALLLCLLVLVRRRAP